MTDHARSVSNPPGFVDLFTPKLITVLREGYGAQDLRADALSGLTVAIVALPLSMAIAIASGTSPERGVYAAIVGGFLVSALGGSRFQIGGPAGAFIVLVASTVHRHGIDGLLAATILAGLILIACGILRLGTYVRFIPFPVTVGFTAGIAAIILASQIRDLLGLTLGVPEPGPLFPKLLVLARALPTVNYSCVSLAALTVITIFGLRRFRPTWPALLIAVAGATILSTIAHLPVDTIGSRFGGIPQALPLPQLPNVSVDKLVEVLPDALSFALLGAIESLLSAVVADGMTGRRHRSNCELVAQGVANIGSALFGGLCVTGAIARTATNVRSGARGPVAGMFHSLYLLLFVLIAAPLAQYIPLSALAGVLVTVAVAMTERHTFVSLLQSKGGDAMVLLSTFFLTIFKGVSEGIVIGFAIGALLFIGRMAKSISIETQTDFVPEDRADNEREDGRTRYDPPSAQLKQTVIYRINGAFFFGSSSIVGAFLDRIETGAQSYILDFAKVPLIDSTGIYLLKTFAEKIARRRIVLCLTGVRQDIRRLLEFHGLASPLVRYEPTIDDALRALSSASQ